MNLIDGHMHLEYGVLDTEYVMQFVETAKQRNLQTIQILDHTHRFAEFYDCYERLREEPQQKAWLSNPKMKFKDHLEDLMELKRKVDRMDLEIEVRIGLEVCYTPESETMLREILAPYHFDFLVGSVHSIDGILYDMSFSKELLWNRFDVNDIYRRYYRAVLACVNSGLFTQLGHPDTIKMHGIYPTYDLQDTYEELAIALKKSDMKAECNTGCKYRYDHPDIGLSDTLLETFVRHGVEIITASDAHHPEDVGMWIKEAQERIDTCQRRFSVCD